jgi:hypothetical protein
MCCRCTRPHRATSWSLRRRGDVTHPVTRGAIVAPWLLMTRVRCSCPRRRLWPTCTEKCRRSGTETWRTRRCRPTWPTSYAGVSHLGCTVSTVTERQRIGEHCLRICCNSSQKKQNTEMILVQKTNLQKQTSYKRFQILKYYFTLKDKFKNTLEPLYRTSKETKCFTLNDTKYR